MAPLSRCQPSFRNAKLYGIEIFDLINIQLLSPPPPQPGWGSRTQTSAYRPATTPEIDAACWLMFQNWFHITKKQLTWLMTGSCSLTRSWIGCGAMFSPPAVMIRSFSLPTIAWKPSLSIDTKSPDLGEGLLEMQDKYWELTSASHPRSCPS